MTKSFNAVDQYIKGCTKEIVPLIKEMRSFILKSLPDAKEGMQYGVPVFYNAKKASVIYLYGSHNHLNFGFLKSKEITDPKGVLQGSGKPSKHLKIYPDKKVDKSTLRAFIKQCETIEP